MDTLKNYTWEQSNHWLSLDVKSLYSSILHEVGLTPRGNFLAKRTQFAPYPATVHSGRYSLLSWAQLFKISGGLLHPNARHSHGRKNVNSWVGGRSPAFGAIIPSSKYCFLQQVYQRYHRHIGQPQSTIISFVQHCNANNLGLSFTNV